MRKSECGSMSVKYGKDIGFTIDLPTVKTERHDIVASAGTVRSVARNVRPTERVELAITAEEGATVRVELANRGMVRAAITVGRGAAVFWTERHADADFVQSISATTLAGEGARIEIRSVFEGRGSSRFDIGHTIIHEAPRTASSVVVRGALDGRAHAIPRALTRIETTAAGSNATQKIDVLLLSPNAEADPLPQLEIFTHDDRCSHGATVGHIDSEKLFYLKSRGLDDPSARRLIVEGFLSYVT